jgi:hypothetical protein
MYLNTLLKHVPLRKTFMSRVISIRPTQLCCNTKTKLLNNYLIELILLF